MRRNRSLALIAAPIVLATALVGCSSDSPTDQAVENAIENANPSIDADVSDDGKGVTATDDSGNSISAGSSAKVPDGFPSQVPLPSSLTLLSAASSGEGNYIVSYQTTDAAAALSEYQAQLQSAGFTIDDTASAAGASTFTAKGQGFEVVALNLANSLSITVESD